MRTRLSLPVLCLSLGLCGPALAMTYAPLPDTELFDAAAAVVLGEVTAAGADGADAASSTRYRVHIVEAFKGAIGGDELELRVPGAFDRAHEGALWIPGVPHFATGQRVMLFLDRDAGGAWTLSQLALGAFHVAATAQGEVLEQDLSDAEVLGAKAAGPTSSVRSLAHFSRWLHARAAGRAMAEDYWREADAGASRAKYGLLGEPARWFAFDEGRSITLYAGEVGQVGLLGGGYAEFVAAIRAWNDDPGSNVGYAYGGTAAGGGGTGSPDGINTILFNDPHDSLPGVVTCPTGGVVAYAGFRTSGLREWRGAMYRAITEVDIVVQAGAGCLLGRNNNTSAAEVFAHELGHTLGLAHSCGEAAAPVCARGSAVDEAVMRPVLHGDGRGAALGDDDRAGIRQLYGDGGGSSPPSATVASPPTESGSNVSGGGALGDGVLGFLMMLLAIRHWPPARPRGTSMAKGPSFATAPKAGPCHAECRAIRVRSALPADDANRWPRLDRSRGPSALEPAGARPALAGGVPRRLA
ncbi:MAG TPA: matrixin family metalloprotease [Solimonas sp.]|nr:matrixin family metalloprotease [Solimonas sp.]